MTSFNCKFVTQIYEKTNKISVFLLGGKESKIIVLSVWTIKEEG